MPRFGLVGPSYTNQSVNADAQQTMNLYPEIDESGAGNAPIILLPTPGLKLFAAPQSDIIEAFTAKIPAFAINNSNRTCIVGYSGGTSATCTAPGLISQPDIAIGDIAFMQVVTTGPGNTPVNPVTGIVDNFSNDWQQLGVNQQFIDPAFLQAGYIMQIYWAEMTAAASYASPLVATLTLAGTDDNVFIGFMNVKGLAASPSTVKQALTAGANPSSGNLTIKPQSMVVSFAAGWSLGSLTLPSGYSDTLIYNFSGSIQWGGGYELKANGTYTDQWTGTSPANSSSYATTLVAFPLQGVTLADTVQAGDTIIFSLLADADSETPVIYDGEGGNTWSSYEVKTVTGFKAAVFVCKVAVGGSSFFINVGGLDVGSQLSGCNVRGLGALDQHASTFTTSGSSTYSSGNVTPTQTGEALFGFCASTNAINPSVADSFTLLESANAVGVDHTSQLAEAPVSSSWTTDTNATYAAILSFPVN